MSERINQTVRALAITTATLRMLLDETGAIVPDDGRMAGMVRAAIEQGERTLDVVAPKRSGRQ